MTKQVVIHLIHIDNSGPICGVKGNVKTDEFDYTCKRCEATLHKGKRMVWYS